MITLLTDFGTQDAYVGMIKGMIASRCPTMPLIDLSHAVPPQDVVAARFLLLSAFPYFPPQTIHLVVVDPGVGTSRRAIAVQLAGGFFVGPDNGVLSGVFDQTPIVKAVELTNPAFWRTPNPSATFHGRDIFAPVAAHLAGGLALEHLGTPLAADSLVRLDLPALMTTDQGRVGCIQYIDHFGNAVTTIPAEALGDCPWQIQVGQTVLSGTRTYNSVQRSDPLALVGSHGFVEIAVNQGSAQQDLGLAVGDRVVWLAGGRLPPST
jgi:S-adenosyl-L-methionine hydrolase (adenosine-forming)